MANTAAPTLTLAAQDILYVPPPLIFDPASTNLIYIGEPGPDNFEYNLNQTTEDLTNLVNSTEVVIGVRDSGVSPQMVYSNLKSIIPGVQTGHQGRLTETVTINKSFYFGPATIEEGGTMDYSGTNSETAILADDEAAQRLWVWSPGDLMSPITELTNEAYVADPAPVTAGSYMQGAGGIWRFNPADFTPGSTQFMTYIPSLSATTDVAQVGSTIVQQVFAQQKIVTTQLQIMEVSGTALIRKSGGAAVAAGGTTVTLQFLPVGCANGANIRWYEVDELYQVVCRQ